jgi:Ca-activated chloride channel family protein
MLGRKSIMALVLFAAVIAVPCLAMANGVMHIEEERTRAWRPPDITRSNPMDIKSATLDVTIENQVATTVVDEVFYNPNTWQLEGTFIFPLTDDATIKKFSMWINGVEKEGELLDADKARGEYERIVRSMRDPGLLEYMGSRMFKLSIFPIPPQSDVRVKFEYSQMLANEGGMCTYKYPRATNKYSGSPLQDANIKMTIKSNIKLKSIYSPSHTNVDIVKKDDFSATVALEEKNTKPDRDFVLYYSFSEKDFGLNMVTHRKTGEEGYFMALISPKQDVDMSEVAKKDIVFIIDTSGSMSDADPQNKEKVLKIDQAKKALNFCVNSLYPGDRFNIISFSTEVKPFKTELQEFTDETKAAAIEHIKGLRARGGTNVHGALTTAIDMQPKEGSRPYMVVFITDGQPTIGEITDPNGILNAVKAKNSSKMRLFTFGVGYDVNTLLLDKLAEMNRGAREYVTPEENLETKVSTFIEKASQPVLSDLKLEMADLKIEDRYPLELPDLFKGSQLVVYGRYSGEGQKLIRLTGTVNGKPMTFDYETTFPAVSAGNDFLPRQWAMSKIGYLMDQVRLHGEKKEVKDEIIALAKEHGIVTKYTSWLVLEDGALAAGAPGGRMRERLERRGGEDMEKVRGAVGFGGGADGAPSAPASGDTAVAASKEMKKMKDASKANAEEMLDIDVRDLVKFIGDKTFYLDDKGTWVDGKAKKDGPAPIRVKYLSDEYFKLLKDTPNLSKYLTAGGKMTVCLDDKVYEIFDEEVKEPAK